MGGRGNLEAVHLFPDLCSICRLYYNILHWPYVQAPPFQSGGAWTQGSFSYYKWQTLLQLGNVVHFTRVSLVWKQV